MQRVDETIADVRATEEDKFEGIKKYLDLQKQASLMGVMRQQETGQQPAPNGGNRNTGYQSEAGEHNCSRDKRCRSDWDLLGCVELYKLKTVRERTEFLKGFLACFKCGKIVEGGFRGHICDWNRSKNDAKCQGQGQNCIFAAATCSRHPKGASSNLRDWLQRSKIRSTVTVAILTPQCEVPSGYSVTLGDSKNLKESRSSANSNPINKKS